MSPPNDAARRTRQKRTILALATFLILAGLAMLFVLQRVPLPTRILSGLVNIVAGAGLFVLVRQKFGK
jgi:hypothetical protein